MKKTNMTAATTTFSLTDYSSRGRMQLESQIIERAIEHWRKKHPSRSPSAPPPRSRDL